MVSGLGSNRARREVLGKLARTISDEGWDGIGWRMVAEGCCWAAAATVPEVETFGCWLGLLVLAVHVLEKKTETTRKHGERDKPKTSIFQRKLESVRRVLHATIDGKDPLLK